MFEERLHRRFTRTCRAIRRQVSVSLFLSFFLTPLFQVVDWKASDQWGQGIQITCRSTADVVEPRSSRLVGGLTVSPFKIQILRILLQWSIQNRRESGRTRQNSNSERMPGGTSVQVIVFFFFFVLSRSLFIDHRAHDINKWR